MQATGEVLHRSLLLVAAGRTLCATVQPAVLWANAHTRRATVRTDPHRGPCATTPVVKHEALTS